MGVRREAEGREPTQWGDWTSPGITIEPEEKAKAKTRTVRLQSDPIGVRNVRIQASEPKEIAVQADIHEGATGGAVDAERIVRSPDFLAFLRTAEQRFLEEQRVSALSQELSAFESYEPTWEEAAEDAQVVRTFRREHTELLRVTAVSWNSTGSRLAVAYGRPDILGWCEFDSSVALYSLARSQETPDIVIDLPAGCCFSLAFHPINPAILAGGTYSGELIVWNTNESDPQVCSSSIDDYFHREAIMKVEWFLEDVVGEEYNLATVSGDGKVLIWDYKFNNLQYPIRGHTLVNPKKKVVGGRMVAFSQQDPTTFMVGSETGVVLRAIRGPKLDDPQIAGMSPGVQWKKDARQILGPLGPQARTKVQQHVENFCVLHGIKDVTAETIFKSKPDAILLFPMPKAMELDAHAGPVTAAQFSPYYRRLLLTAGFDGCVQLRDTSQKGPILVACPPTGTSSSSDPVSAVAWSPSRAAVFACGSEAGGNVFVYDLAASSESGVLSTEPQVLSLGKECRGVTALAFNAKIRDLIAVGDVHGVVRLMRLPHSLTVPQKGDQTFLPQSRKAEGSV
jgi:WD40 repeat protein